MARTGRVLARECDVTVNPLLGERLAVQLEVRHGFFTREGGVSGGVYEGLNCGLREGGDDPSAVRENRRLAAAALGVRPDRLLLGRQVHGSRVVTDREVANAEKPPEADAILSRTPGVAVGVLTADCVPVLLAESLAGVVAAVHVGWRGALSGAVEAAVSAMAAEGAMRECTVAAVGPAISAARYEVGPEFREEFLDRDPFSAAHFRRDAASGRICFDLPGYVFCRLAEARVACIESLGLCTYGDPARFFSHRRARHRGEAGHGLQLSAIAVVTEEGAA